MTANKSDPSRRIFLRGVLGTAAFAGFGQVFGIGPVVNKPGLNHASVLGLAATAEALSVTVYQQALGRSTFGMNADARRQLQKVLAAEQSHLELLTKLGGAPLTRQFSLPADLLEDAGVFADTALHLEQACAEAYIAASHQFAVLGRPELAATAAQLAASEAQQLTVLSQLAGFGPGELALPAVPFRQIADVPPVLAPFIGHAGAGRFTAELPTVAEVKALTA